MNFSLFNMMLVLLVGTTMMMMMPTTFAKPIATCPEQKGCVVFTAHKVEDIDGSVCDCDCYFNICMTIDTDLPSCQKEGTISHTCEKNSMECADTLGFGTATEVQAIGDGYNSCQKVPPGGTAMFLLKDGSAKKDGCGSDSMAFQSDYSASCETFVGDSCTGNVGTECVWTIAAPENCNKIGGCFGDPHLKRWDQKRFDFHGECDLVLVHSDHVNGDLPLDLHVRTTIRDHFSYIESAALKVGNTVFQLDSDKFFVDGNEHSDADLPLVLHEFTIEPVKQQGVPKIYTVVLTDLSVINFKVIKNFISVSVSGHGHDFGQSVGLLGDYYTGEALGRDGRVMEDFEEFGMEWQVAQSEPMLFQQARAPQLPYAKCVMPTEMATGRRHLLRNTVDDEFTALAEGVCNTKEDFESCMEDVLATGDIDLAGAW